MNWIESLSTSKRKKSGILFTRCFHWKDFLCGAFVVLLFYFLDIFTLAFLCCCCFYKNKYKYTHITIFKPLLLGWSIFVWLSRFVDWAWVRACICYCCGLSVWILCVSDRCLTASTAPTVDSLSFSRQHTLNLLRFRDSAAHRRSRRAERTKWNENKKWRESTWC